MKHYKFYVIALAFIILSVPAVASAVKYKCTSDSGIGFTYNTQGKNWEAKIYQTNIKYIISPAERTPEGEMPKDVAYSVTIVYEALPYCSCKEDFNKYGDLFCDCVAGMFTFNRDTGRFLYGYMAGYYSQRYSAMKDEPISQRNTRDPYMAIGTCSEY